MTLQEQLWLDEQQRAGRQFRQFGELDPHFIHEDERGVVIFAIAFASVFFSLGLAVGWAL